jgi:hypothetical protein
MWKYRSELGKGKLHRLINPLFNLTLYLFSPRLVEVVGDGLSCIKLEVDRDAIVQVLQMESKGKSFR